MRVGYSYWGFLGDNKVEDGKEVSTPDGNATYSWSILWEMHRRGWDVFAMQKDRDWEAFKKHGKYNFFAFSQKKRMDAYLYTQQTRGEALPPLDVLLVEWRFPIFGRNCTSWEGVPAFPTDMKNYQGEKLQPDLKRQYELLEHYRGKGTKLIFWDLDHKLDEKDEKYWKPDAIFETSVQPRRLSMERTSVEPPVLVGDLLQYPTLEANQKRKSVYIGSRYERDDVITQYLKPLSDRYPNEVEFWGNWLRTVEECRQLWPNVSYNDRITTKDFRRVYGDAVSCPLLAKRSYLQTGFITPRPWEALMFGTIPVGLSEARSIGRYTLFQATDGEHMAELVEHMVRMPLWERDRYRKQNIEKLSFMDAKHFVDKIEYVTNGNDLAVDH